MGSERKGAKDQEGFPRKTQKLKINRDGGENPKGRRQEKNLGGLRKVMNREKARSGSRRRQGANVEWGGGMEGRAREAGKTYSRACENRKGGKTETISFPSGGGRSVRRPSSGMEELDDGAG